MDLSVVSTNSISNEEIDKVIAFLKKLNSHEKDIILASLRGAELVSDLYKKRSMTFSMSSVDRM